MNIKAIVLGILALSVFSVAVARTSAPTGAVVYIISPSHGEVVRSPVVVKFGLKGMGVAPAGVDKANTGHHHLLIDVAKTPSLDAPLLSDSHHKHYGGGQTETTILLIPGHHTLQLIMGDKNHIPHDPPIMSEPITITVE